MATEKKTHMKSVESIIERLKEMKDGEITTALSFEKKKYTEEGNDGFLIVMKMSFETQSQRANLQMTFPPKDLDFMVSAYVEQLKESFPGANSPPTEGLMKMIEKYRS